MIFILAYPIFCRSRDPDIKSLFEMGKIKIDVPGWATLPDMVGVATLLMNSFLEKNWKFYVLSKDRYLVTSDNPVYFGNVHAPYAGPAHPFSEVILHLRKDLALVITPHSPDMVVLNMTNQEVNKFNKGVARGAREYVYSPVKDDALGRMIAKIKDNGQHSFSISNNICPKSIPQGSSIKWNNL